jgi:H+/Cl- antiporter ClcA
MLKELNYIDEELMDTQRKNFIILGVSGMMAGYTRMTYSLAIILMETSLDMNLFVPILFTNLISN